MRNPNGAENEPPKTDDQKKSSSKYPVARVHDRGHYLTLIVGKGLNSKDSSKWCGFEAEFIGF